MLATYLLRMCNINLKTRIAGSSSRPQLPSFEILKFQRDSKALVWFSLCLSLFLELRDNGVVKNLQF